MNKLKTVKISNLTVDDRVKNLHKGYELFSEKQGTVTFELNDEIGVNRIAVRDLDGKVHWFNAHGGEWIKKDNAWDEQGNETRLWPNKVYKTWQFFYAPAKNEVVYYENYNSIHVHIAGKWFRFTSTSSVELIEELGEPCYIAERKIHGCTNGYISTILEELKNEKGLVLNQDTLEWSEVKEEEYTLSDGSKAKEGDCIVVIDDFTKDTSVECPTTLWTGAILKEKCGSRHSYVCKDGVGYEYALPVKGNKWRIGGNSKLEDTEPKQEIILSDGSKCMEGQSLLVCNYNEVWVKRNCDYIYSEYKENGYMAEGYLYINAIPFNGNEDLEGKYFQPWHIGKKWPSGLRTGQPVLMRDDNTSDWEYAIYSHVDSFSDNITTGSNCCVCIPYNGNEMLVGTNEEPKKE